jgi:hypothetical protein
MSETRKPHRAAKTTIVGGQPAGNSRDVATVPVGLEELLGMAAMDDDFAEALLTDPDPAVEASGVTLTSTEQTILRGLRQATLEPMIARIRQHLPEPERRAFLEQGAAAVALLVGGGALLAATGCKDDRKPSARKTTSPRRMAPDRDAVDTGARPDRPPMQRDPGDAQDAGVITMDTPEPRPQPKPRPRPGPREMHYSKGIRPRRPRPRSFDPRDTRTTGISPDRPKRRGDK